MDYKLHSYGNKPNNKIAANSKALILEIPNVEADTAMLKQLCLDYESKIMELPINMLGLSADSVTNPPRTTIEDSTTTRHRSYNILSWLGFEHLYPKIKESIQLYCDLYDQEYLPTAIGSWINIYRDDQYIAKHCHGYGPNSWISGVLSIDSEGTKTGLQNPITTETFYYEHKNGSLILFPDWILHWSESTGKDNRRIVLAFDTSVIPDIMWGKNRKEWAWL